MNDQSVSVLILTLDEEINIAACIESLRWSDDVVVLDSLSKDQTTQIAAGLGARVVRRPFDDWSAHQNWAVRNIEFRHPWVLYMDADERCEPELRDEVLRVATADAPAHAFRVRRKDYFMGTWLRHAQLYPTWFTRLFRPQSICYERLVNPIAVVNGPTESLQAHIIHYPFSHGVGHWIARHNRYSDFEAAEMLKVRDSSPRWSADFLSRDPAVRRRALKNLYFRMPVRPAVKFIYYYMMRRGFLDGRPGLTYSTLQAVYEFFIDCKYRELRRRQKRLPL